MLRILRLLLFPISLLYTCGVFVRNLLYDLHVLGSKKGALPTIVLGNLSAGGTGKTPHAEYLLRYLETKGKPGFLSRGYGRSTKGFILAGKNADARQLGDEPMQIHRKFATIPVAVCKDRQAGIRELKNRTDAQWIVLDDAYQHRSLIGDLNILLIDYNRPYWKDLPLPSGDLRDNVRQKKRADIVIVTKCPSDMSQSKKEQLRKRISLLPGQELFFTTYTYGVPVQIRGEQKQLRIGQAVVGFSGIAHYETFRSHLEKNFALCRFAAFTDHHNFSQGEIKNLWNECGRFASPEMLMITTEKDATRLLEIRGIENIPIFYIPIKVQFLEGEEKFHSLINKTMTIASFAQP